MAYFLAALCGVVAVGAIDIWDTPTDFSAPTTIYEPCRPDVTYRGFGTPRYSFKNSSRVVTNTEVLTNTITGLLFPRLSTNSVNFTDIFLAFSSGATGQGPDNTIDIIQIDP